MGNEAIDKDIESWRYIVRYESWFNPLFEVVYGIAYILAFTFGVYFIVSSAISLGQLVTFVSYVGMLYGPIIAISTIFTQINNATVAIDRYDEVITQLPEVHDVASSKKIIQFNQIKFEDILLLSILLIKNPVIKNITFEINNGETIGIVGPTGSGKSTLIRQLLEFNVTKWFDFN